MFYHKNFSRGCAPHPLSLKTRFSLYHIKVLHLFANRLLALHCGVTSDHIAYVILFDLDASSDRYHVASAQPSQTERLLRIHALSRHGSGGTP